MNDPPNLEGRICHAGELNVDFDSHFNGKSYTATATIKDPLLTPYSSIASIEERIGEVATYTNVDGNGTFQIIIDIPEDSPLGKWYYNKIQSVLDNAYAKAQKKGGYDLTKLKVFHDSILDNIVWGN